MLTRLIRRGWLYRCIEADLPDGPLVVEYRRPGGRLARKWSSMDTYHHAGLRICGSCLGFPSPWAVNRRSSRSASGHGSGSESLVLRVNDKVIYAEGTGPDGREAGGRV